MCSNLTGRALSPTPLEQKLQREVVHAAWGHAFGPELTM